MGFGRPEWPSIIDRAPDAAETTDACGRATQEGLSFLSSWALVGDKATKTLQ